MEELTMSAMGTIKLTDGRHIIVDTTTAGGVAIHVGDMKLHLTVEQAAHLSFYLGMAIDDLTPTPK
jgi:hypothetical protein